MVDAHAEVFVKIAGAVVPPRVPAWFLVMQSVGIDESCARQPCKCQPLTLRHMCPPVTGTRVPDIDIFGCHVEIAADHGRRSRSDSLADPACQPVKPQELRFVER